MKETFEFLLFVGFTLMLFLLRLDARRFGVAEYDDEQRSGGWRGWLRRLTWYALGIALVLVIYALYPQPISVLHLDLGPDREQALLLGLLYGIVGTLVAFTFAWLRYGRFRLPAARFYPGALINALGTAFIDEALFRGIILGMLLHWGWPTAVAIAAETIIYALATRLGAPGRGGGGLLVALGIGAVSGILVVDTLGIGAAILGHAITRFSTFLATGHTGHARPPGWEVEEVAGWALPPEGWGYVGDEPPSPQDVPQPGAASRAYAGPYPYDQTTPQVATIEPTGQAARRPMVAPGLTAVPGGPPAGSAQSRSSTPSGTSAAAYASQPYAQPPQAAQPYATQAITPQPSLPPRGWVPASSAPPGPPYPGQPYPGQPYQYPAAVQGQPLGGASASGAVPRGALPNAAAAPPYPAAGPQPYPSSVTQPYPGAAPQPHAGAAAQPYLGPAQQPYPGAAPQPSPGAAPQPYPGGGVYPGAPPNPGATPQPNPGTRRVDPAAPPEARPT